MKLETMVFAATATLAIAGGHMAAQWTEVEAAAEELEIQLPAPGLPSCAPAKLMDDVLSEKFGERLLWRGAVADGSYLALYSSADGSSWTMLAITSSGLACVRSTGTLGRLTPRPAGEPA